jgi:hypothetical protein
MKSVSKKKVDAYKRHESAEQKSGHEKMEMIEGKMHGKNRGSRSKNYKGKSC